MPDIGTGIGAGASLLGGLFGGGGESGERNSSSTLNRWGKTDTSSRGYSNKAYEYMPSLTADEKLAMWSAAKDRINKSWLSNRQATSEGLASKGLTGGPMVKDFALGDRARNEALSGAATGIEVEGAKKLIKNVSDTSQNYGTTYSNENQTGTGNSTLTSGSSNPWGDLLGGAGGALLGNSDWTKWLSGIFGGAGKSGYGGGYGADGGW